MADTPDPVVTPVDDPPVVPDPKPKEGELKLTQDELNKMMADNRRSLTKKNEEMAKQLEALQSQSRMTAEERDELAQTIETLRTQTMTQEELAKREAKKAAESHLQALNTLTEDRDQWKTLYEKETIQRAIIDAASVPEHKAYDPSQIVAILGNQTHLQTVKNEETGEESLQPRVTYNHVDEEGKTKQLEIAPAEAVKLMKETKRFANLFLAPNAKGLGGDANVGEGSNEPKMDNMESYMAWRKTQKEFG